MFKPENLHRKEIKRPTTKEQIALLRPYQLAIGDLAIMWNQLHDRLAELFWTVTGVENGMIALAIWHSTPSDFAQRKMLRAATSARFDKDSKERIEIDYILDIIDKSLSAKRNDAIHAPLYILTNITYGSRVEPHADPIHPRVRSLKGKSALDEYKWYSRMCSETALYAFKIRNSLAFPDFHSWPERPPLPTLQHTKAPRKAPHVAPRIRPPRQP